MFWAQLHHDLVYKSGFSLKNILRFWYPAYFSLILKLFPPLVSNNSPYSTITCRCFWLLTRRVSWFQFHGRPWNPASFIALTQFSKSFEACTPPSLRGKGNSSFYLEFSSLFFLCCFPFVTNTCKKYKGFHVIDFNSTWIYYFSLFQVFDLCW